MAGELHKDHFVFREAEKAKVPEDWLLALDGIALVHRGKNEEAIKVLNKADSNNLPARAMLSYSLFHTGRWEEWSRVVSELKDAQPRQEYEEFDQLFLGYAYFYVNHEVSAELLRKVLEQHPTWIVPLEHSRWRLVTFSDERSNGGTATG